MYNDRDFLTSWYKIAQVGCQAVKINQVNNKPLYGRN